MSLDERAEILKRMVSDAVANPHRDQYIEDLVARGLSPSDSAHIVQTLFDALAECHFEAARRRYEAYGLTLEQFISGAEEVWNGTPAEDFAILAEPNLLTEPRVAGAASPDWASQMEANILAHIERYPNVVLTDLRIKCEERGCAVLMRGRNIQVFRFELDRFAEENGFARALPYGNESQRTVWLLK